MAARRRARWPSRPRGLPRWLRRSRRPRSPGPRPRPRLRRRPRRRRPSRARVRARARPAIFGLGIGDDRRGDDRRGRDRRLEDAEHPGQGRRGGLVAGRRLEPGRVRLDLAAALARLGQLERPAGRVARVGEPVRPVEDVREPVEQLRRLDPPPGRGQEVRLAAQRGLVPRRELQRPAVRLHRLGRPVHLHEDPADRRVRQRPVRRDLGRLAVRPDRRFEAAAERRDVPPPERVLVALVQRVRGRRPRLLLRTVSHRSPRRAALSGRGAGSPTDPR